MSCCLFSEPVSILGYVRKQYSKKENHLGEGEREHHSMPKTRTRADQDKCVSVGACSMGGFFYMGFSILIIYSHG